MFVNHGLNTFLLAKSRETMFLLTSSVCTLVNVAANFILIPRFSYFGAAGVTILTELVLLVQNVTIIRRTLGFLPVISKVWSTSAVFIVLLFMGLAASSYIGAFWLTLASCLLLAACFYVNGYVRSTLRWTSIDPIVTEGVSD
jgi:O-antigen/teichoic acid export membrane protein